MSTEILDIGEVSKFAKLPVSTLRYYEEKGLIQSAGRRGLRRLFDGKVVERLALITLARKAHFSLEEISTMLGTDGSVHINRNKLRDKAQALDQTIRQLTTLRNGLNHIAECEAPSHLECPKFRRLMRLAGKGKADAGPKNPSINF
ncbi:helix-turn-helix domain-containing protein [Sneathiella sp.]|jgi:DNA-binding transcriptional MerR regulator|uniref:helix-turn-helix domain-containing protein n=1 Tax=Sneathiella sp. TaxID=1964365 RepID=UPI0039E72A94